MIISKEKYERLLEDSKKLGFLRMYDVEEWAYYSDAMDEYKQNQY